MRRLFGKLLEADSSALLDAIDEQYRVGVEPLSLMNGLLSLSHQVTLYKVGRVNDPTLSDEAKTQLGAWAEKLSYPVLHRLWQLLLKGYEEVQQAHMPREACDMALLRVLCAADMPDPGELAKVLQQDKASTPPPQVDAAPAQMAATVQEASPAANIHAPAANISAPAVKPQPIETKQTAPAMDLPQDFQSVINIIGGVSPVLESILIADMRIISFSAPMIEFQSARPIAATDLKKITDALKDATGVVWTIQEGQGDAKPSISEQAQLDQDAATQAILDTPLVKAAFEAFPGAELLENDTDQAQIESRPESRSSQA